VTTAQSRTQPMSVGVSVAEYRAALRKETQMPKEKRNLDTHMDYFAENGMKVEREYRFHPTRKWRFDYALPEFMVAVEFNGMFGGMAHRSVREAIKDSEKLNQAQILGWIVVQVNTASIRDGSAYADIDAAIERNSVK
jgi:hypothetical protein